MASASTPSTSSRCACCPRSGSCGGRRAAAGGRSYDRREGPSGAPRRGAGRAAPRATRALRLPRRRPPPPRARRAAPLPPRQHARLRGRRALRGSRPQRRRGRALRARGLVSRSGRLEQPRAGLPDRPRRRRGRGRRAPPRGSSTGSTTASTSLLAERLLEAEAPPRGLAAAVGVGTLAPRRLDPHASSPSRPPRRPRAIGAVLTLALRHLLAVDLERHGAQLEIEEFVGDWVETGARSQFCLGDRGRSALGRSTVVGAWCRDPSSRVRVKIGRVDADAAATFSPGGAAFVRLSEALSVLVRDPLEFELELWVVGSIAPPLGALRLGVDFRVFAPKTEGRALRFPLPLPADPQRGEPFAPAPDPEGGGPPRRSTPAAPHRDDTES
ncbi:MAG: type VI secretion system baseplate subunit TssG [Nannocystaceae bacterium]